MPESEATKDNSSTYKPLNVEGTNTHPTNSRGRDQDAVGMFHSGPRAMPNRDTAAAK